MTLPPDRTFFLFTGALLTTKLPQGLRLPLRWWPADHAWCVGNDIYARSVFVGGASDVIEAILHAPRLEAFEVEASSRVSPEDR